MDGILKKTHENSYFKYFHGNSRFANKIFADGSSEVVLQIMKMDEGYCLAELVNRLQL